MYLLHVCMLCSINHQLFPSCEFICVNSVCPSRAHNWSKIYLDFIETDRSDITGTRIPDPSPTPAPFPSFGHSRDYGMDLSLEVYP